MLSRQASPAVATYADAALALRVRAAQGAKRAGPAARGKGARALRYGAQPAGGDDDDAAI